MTTDVTIPASGESVTSANVAMWHHAHGDEVKAGDVLVTIETDKVSNELEAPAGGVLEIVVQEGEEVPIGTLIARIEDSSGGDGSSSESEASEKPKPEAPEQKEEKEEKPTEQKPQEQKPQQDEAASESADKAPVESGADGGVVEIVVPAAGESVSSASVANWRKSDGDSVAAGEVLVTLETDKVSNELEAPAAGTLRILVAEGEEVPIGTTIGKVETTADSGDHESKSDSAPPAEDKKQDTPAEKPEQKTSKAKESAPQPAESKPQASAAPATQQQESSAPNFSLPPVREQKDALEPVNDGRTTRRKMSMLRRKIADHLVNAQQTAAILTTFNEVDMSGVMKLRKEVQEEFIRKHGVKLGFMSFFVKAVVQALKDVPSINGRIEGKEVVENHYYDIGVAIGTDKGLFVPVIRDADKKSFAEIEQDILDYANKAKDGKISIEDLQGGVFSISNGGTYGSLLSTPILNPPQSGILGMHTIQQRPMAVDGEVVIRPMMYLALSYDHRLVDGKEAVGFLIRIKECLESPARLLLEM